MIRNYIEVNLFLNNEPPIPKAILVKLHSYHLLDRVFCIFVTIFVITICIVSSVLEFLLWWVKNYYICLLLCKYSLLGSYYKTSTYKCYRPGFWETYNRKSSTIIRMNSTIHIFLEQYIQGISSQTVKSNLALLRI